MLWPCPSLVPLALPAELIVWAHPASAPPPRGGPRHADGDGGQELAPRYGPPLRGAAVSGHLCVIHAPASFVGDDRGPVCPRLERRRHRQHSTTGLHHTWSPLRCFS